jgi:hypothetical protein
MAKNLGGRPPEWDDHRKQWAMDEICRGLASATSVRKVIGERQDLPSRAEFFLWLIENPRFVDQYAQAKAIQTEFLLEEVPDIADDSGEDIKVFKNKDGQEYEKVNHEVVNRSRLRVDARLKLAEKLAPKKYGITRMEHTGADGKDLFERLSDADLESRIALALAKTRTPGATS